jgi:hypothetical protein
MSREFTDRDRYGARQQACRAIAEFLFGSVRAGGE